ncbi:NAD(P)-binding protein [Acephala macrosclerotiorum]|nr:NAD(P)-binding protein [Acephala macrosclerotiorum]
MNVPKAEIFPLLKDKVAIVTGGSQGIRKTTASVLLRAGAKVVIGDVKVKEGSESVAELPQHGDIIFVRTSISKSEDVQNLVAQTVARFGKLDVAVDSAALTPDSTPLIGFEESYWSKLIDINLTGTALCCKWEMHQMIKQGSKGSIVNIASINAFKPQLNMPAYTTANHAIIVLTKHAAMEGGPKGIRMNAIALGVIFSDMSAAALEIMGTTMGEFSPTVSSLNRFGMAHEVAHGSLWLCSDSASYITGVCLPIDGGCLAK